MAEIRMVKTPKRRMTMSIEADGDHAEEEREEEQRDEEEQDGMALDELESEEQEMVEVPRGTTLVARLALSTPPTSFAPPSSTFIFGSPDAGQVPFTFGAAFNPATDSVAPLKGGAEDGPDMSGMTAAERVMAEVRARVVQERIASGGAADRPLRALGDVLAAGTGTPTAAGGLRRSESQKSLGRTGEVFEGKHKRVFDK